jgi:hypothetical protein
MAVTLNANSSTGFIATSDTSSILQLQTGGTTAVTISAGQVATFAQAPVLPAASIPQAALAANVAGNGPAFYIHAATSTSLPSATYTKVLFDTVSFNTAGSMVANSRFTPTVAGYYQVNASAYYFSAAESFLQFYVNGAQGIRGTDHNSGVYSRYVNAMVYLNGSGDYLEIYAYQATGSTVTISPSSAQTFFQAFLARAA